MSEEFIHPDRTLDVQGMKCPLPILRTKKMLSEMASGQILHILATDLKAVNDFQTFARQTGNILLSVKEMGGVVEFYFQRK